MDTKIGFEKGRRVTVFSFQIEIGVGLEERPIEGKWYLDPGVRLIGEAVFFYQNYVKS